MSDIATVKPIAFVAMPFKVKPTGLNAGQGPAHINFDALWDQAIFPALEQLNYLPVRADNQDGSVIIKDMLEQLIYADLVLVDISIANGNVYYEAGIRHAARAKGCVLMSSDWARPLFDLGQIRQLRYPLHCENPTPADYATITESLVNSIPKLVDAVCPVHALTNLQEQVNVDSQCLRENTHLVSAFQAEIRKCRLASNNEAENLTEALIAHYIESPRTPMFVVRELIELIRDKLGWQDLLDFCKKIGQSAQGDSFVLEQMALATCKTGKPRNAIADIEQLIATQGETPERFGLIAGRYKELYRSEDQPFEKQRWLELTISNYRQGMILDFNQYYCASNLPVLLRIKGPSYDPIEASYIATHVLKVCDRIEQSDDKDQWLTTTRLTMLYFLEDYDGATDVARKVLLQDFASWELESTISNLTAIVEQIEQTQREKFATLLDTMTSRVSIHQNTLSDKVLPLIVSRSQRFEKFQPVRARPARSGETVVSYTQDGRETTNTAAASDFVVENQTGAKEQYIVPQEKFEARYKLLESDDQAWSVYSPLGEILAIKVDAKIVKILKQRDSFYIYAPWNSPQRVRLGDYLVTPLPESKEIYRIANEEFRQTYRPIQ